MQDYATPLITVPYEHEKEVRSVTAPTSKPEHGSIEESTDKSEPVRRPMNAFMLFRRDSPEVQRAYPPITNGTTQYTQGDKSAFASRLWNAMSEREKLPWARAAEEAKLAHQRKYPDYKYCPRRKEQVDRDKEAKKCKGAAVAAGAEKIVAVSSAKGKAKSGGIRKRARTPPKARLAAPSLPSGYFTAVQDGAHWPPSPSPLSGLSYWPISPCGRFYLVPVPIELLGFPLPISAPLIPSSSPVRPEPGPGEVYPSDYLHGFDEHPAVSVADDVVPESPDAPTKDLDRDQPADMNDREHRLEDQTAPSSPDLTVSPNDLSRSMSSLSIGMPAPSCSPSEEDTYRQCAGIVSDTADTSIRRSSPACDDTYLYDWSAHEDSQPLLQPVASLSSLELEKEPSLVFEDWLEMEFIEDIEM